MRRLLPALAALLCAAALAPSACSGGATGGPGDSGLVGDGGPDGGSDGGADAGKADAGCQTDQQCGTNRYCEGTTGNCRDSKRCPQGQGNCDYQVNPSSPDYCGTSLCFCDPADQACKPIHRGCKACGRNVECGNDRNAYDYPADCVGPSDAGTCLPRRDGPAGCPQGYNLPTDGGVYCVPNGGSCDGGGGCTTSASCDPHGATPECNTNQGVCISACSFDLKTGASTCPQGQVCNVDPRLLALQPSETNWARGSCSAPCTAGTNCGGTLACKSEGLDHPVLRCTINGGCLGDVECPDSPATNSYGYCDLGKLACQTGCRTANDCHGGYLCAGGQCVAETCLQAGGASGGCGYGQFCCGEDGGPSTCAANTDAGQCYDAPQQTWCGTCSADTDCRTGSYPHNAKAPNICFANPANSNAKVCWLGCDPAGPASQCPRSWQCQSIDVGCQKAGDCGNQAGARCDNPDGGQGTCGCAQDSDCPNDSSQNFASYCYKSHCIVTTACKPNCK